VESERARVLVVEDDSALRAFIVDFLCLEGLHVREAQEGREALHVLESFRPDLILLDLEMPGMDGPTLLTQLERTDELAAVPVIVVTGNADRWTSPISVAHVVDLLCKPFGTNTLLGAIRRVLAREALAMSPSG
jgi:DNA-binding response OmpR family regulator